MSDITIIKRDGSKEPFDANKINLALMKASEGLPDQISKVVQVASELRLTLFDGMTTEQLDEAVIQTALQNVKDDPDFDTIAARLLLKTMYKTLLGDYETDDELKALHAREFPKYIKRAVKDGLLDVRMADTNVFNVKALAMALDPTRDRLSKYLGVITNKNRYALRKNDGSPLEVPQFTNMRIAMGLSFNEPNPTEAAIRFYRHMSNLEYSPGGSTRVNAGGTFPQLSNCFVIDVEDDMESIAKSIHDTMWIAKGTGGIGISMSKLRAAGITAAVIVAFGAIMLQIPSTRAASLHKKYQFIDTNYSIPSSNVAWVAPNGNDTTGNGSENSPYKTFGKAVTAIPSGGTVAVFIASRTE